MVRRHTHIFTGNVIYMGFIYSKDMTTLHIEFIKE